MQERKEGRKEAELHKGMYKEINRCGEIWIKDNLKIHKLSNCSHVYLYFLILMHLGAYLNYLLIHSFNLTVLSSLHKSNITQINTNISVNTTVC